MLALFMNIWNQACRGCSQTVDLINQLPDMINQLPDMINQLPDMINQLPDMINQLPDLINQLPDMINQLPDMINQLLGRHFLYGVYVQGTSDYYFLNTKGGLFTWPFHTNGEDGYC